MGFFRNNPRSLQRKGSAGGGRYGERDRMRSSIVFHKSVNKFKRCRRLQSPLDKGGFRGILRWRRFEIPPSPLLQRGDIPETHIDIVNEFPRRDARDFVISFLLFSSLWFSACGRKEPPPQ